MHPTPASVGNFMARFQTEVTARRLTKIDLPITALYAEGQSTTMKVVRNVLFAGAVLAVTRSLIDLVGASPSPEKPYMVWLHGSRSLTEKLHPF